MVGAEKSHQVDTLSPSWLECDSMKAEIFFSWALPGTKCPVMLVKMHTSVWTLVGTLGSSWDQSVTHTTSIYQAATPYDTLLVGGGGTGHGLGKQEILQITHTQSLSLPFPLSFSLSSCQLSDIDSPWLISLGVVELSYTQASSISK